MPNDYVTIKALSSELYSMLCGGKIEKIYQPEKDEIYLLIHNKSKFNLVISCNAENPRINITGVKKENPLNAPPFCMHLRKYLVSALISDVSLVNHDRIIDIEFRSKNELKDDVTFHLVCEMMGRYSNILFLDSSYKILDAVKTVSYDTATKRCILPSMPYSAPSQTKADIEDNELIKDVLRSYSTGDLAKYLTMNIAGLSGATAKEIVSKSNIQNNVKSLNEENVNTLADTFNTFLNINSSELYKPAVLLDENDSAIDYYIFPYTTVSTNYKDCNSLNEAIDICLKIKDKEIRHHERTKSLSQSIKKFKEKNMRTLQKAKEKLMDCEKTETYRKFGELITNNIYQIKKGQKSFAAYDYYDNKNIDIPLNIMLSPQQNAQDYYKKYAKLKRTKEIVEKQIEDLEILLDKVADIESSVPNCFTSQDIYELEKELYSYGIIKRFKQDRVKEKKESTPYIFNIDGFTFYVGKNNVQNDKLTFHFAKSNDIWFHAKGYHGSHGILVTDNAKVPDKILEVCAEIILYYSKARSQELVECDYTEKKNVKKQQNYSLGLVNYVNYKSIRAKSNAHKDLLVNG